MACGQDERLEQAQHRRRRVDVGGGGASEDLGELQALLDDAARPKLVLDLAQEVLLARDPDEVVVVVAVADVVERVLPAQLLVSGRHVDRRVLL